MSAGEFPAGEGPCGLDPIPAKSAASVTGKPPILVFDLRTRRFISRAGVDATDAEVTIALGTVQRSLASAPTVGNTLSGIPRVGSRDFEAQVADRVRLALARPIRESRIRIDSITTTVYTGAQRGRWDCFVDYTNLVRAGSGQAQIGTS